MNADQTITLSEKVSQQPSGIVLVWSVRTDTGTTDTGFIHNFVSKHFVSAMAGKGSCFMMLGYAPYTRVGGKYLYIHDDKIVGNADNMASGTANGVTFSNTSFVLRYVIGV
ncbi:MAG: hypothetical protein ACI4NM_11930 [Bullifex sp.]